MARVRKIVEEEIVTPAGAVDDAEQVPGAYSYTVPLFEHAGLDPTRVPGGIGVTREDPPDGYIGHFPPGTTKEDLKRLVGGYVLSLELKDSNGKVMKGGQQKMLRIDAPPVASASAKAAAEELKKGGLGGVGTPDQFARILEIQRTAIDEIRTRSNDAVSIMRTELEGAAARRAADADAAIRRMNEEAKIRSEEADAKHKRELEMARTYQEAQLTREREQRALEAKQHTEMISMIQHNAAQQTQVVVASMGQKTDAMAVIKEMMALAIPLLPMLSGQEDPGVAITKAVSTSLESMSKLASNEQGSSNGKEIVRANGANGQKVAAKPSADAADKKSRLIAKVGALFQAVNAAGHDPEAMLDGAIKHYNAQAGDGDDDPEGEPVDDGAGDGQTRGHAPKRAKRRARTRPKPSRVARRAGSKSKPASKPVVERRAATHGRPKAKGSARSNASGSKRHR